MQLELSRPFSLGRLGRGTDITVTAKPDECAALAVRMGIVALHRLTCRFDLTPGPRAHIIGARGRLEADVTQTCVVSLEEFSSTVVEDFEVNFVPAGSESDDIDFDAIDEIPYHGDMLDLGEACAEQLALALDPFPRKPGTAFAGQEEE